MQTKSPSGRALEESPALVHLSALKLTEFRNFETQSLTFDRRPVVLVGPNGAGKTNLLEAISLLSPGRGLRRARLIDVARRQGKGGWAVAATLSGPAGSTDVGTGIAQATDGVVSQRLVRINHATAPSSQSLLEHVRVVWLTPAMDGLFTGPSADRRRFLDRLVLAIDIRHGSRVSNYEKAMRGRNRLLEEQAGNRDWLDAIEAQMAELAVAIAAARRECLALLTESVAASGYDGPFPAAEIAVEGVVEAALDANGATEAEDRFRRDLRDSRSADRAAKRTRLGPHLSDLKVVHGPKQSPAAECSTGEQKALLIGIVLAHGKLIGRLSGNTPLLLLDEVGAHLDSDRRADLFRILLALGCQAWLTGTEQGPFAGLADAAQHVSVANGQVEPRSSRE